MAGNKRIADLHAALTWDLSDFERGTRKIVAGLSNLVNLAGRMADAVSNAGKRMTLGLSLPMAGIATFVTKAVSDANELQSAFDTTFGNMAARMNRWAEESGNAMGRATQEMQEGALAFGRLFKQAAPSDEDAARYSQRFTELAQDAASFYNTNFDTAMGKIRSGLTGEAEPLRDFGVFLSEAAVNAKGLEMGLIEVGQELNEQGKIMARAELISEGLMDAYGDIARTSDSLANRVKALGGMVRELAIEFGQYLVPYAKAAAAGIANVLQWVQNLPEGVKRAAVGFGIFLAALGPLTVALSMLAVFVMPLLLLRFASFATLGGRLLFAVSAILNPIGTLAIVGGKLALSFGSIAGLLGRLMPLFLRFAGPVGAVITLFQLFGRDIADGVQRWADAIREAVGPQAQQLFAELAELAQDLRVSFDELANSELAKGLSKLKSFIGELIGDFLEMWGVINGVVLSGIVQAVTAIVRVIGDGVDAVNSILKNGWEGGWEGAVQAVGRAIMRIGQWIQRIWPALGALVMLLGQLTGAKFDMPEKAPGLGGESDRPAAPGRTDSAIRGGNYALDQDDKKKTSRAASRGRSGPSAKELAERREALELDHQIALARERGDIEELRRLEAKRELTRSIQQYERAGLSTGQAKVAAERDAFELESARLDAMRQAIVERGVDVEWQVAQLDNDYEHLRYLEDEEYIKRAIRELQSDTVNLAEAEVIAQGELAEIEAARTRQIERRLAAQRAAHSIELAELRGDRALADSMREDERIRARAKELEKDFELSPVDALEQAHREAADRSRAYLQGSFRDAMRGGLYAAMNGNFWDWFRDRMRESSFNALAKALDRLADRLADMVFDGASGGGGLLGGIGGFLGKVFGVSSASVGVSPGSHEGLHGFVSGGSFKIRGFPGIDRNILSLNGTPVAKVSQSEIIDVKRGDQASGGGAHVGVDVRLHGFTEMFDMQVDKRIGRAAPGIAAQGAADGVKNMIDLNQRTFGSALSPQT